MESVLGVAAVHAGKWSSLSKQRMGLLVVNLWHWYGLVCELLREVVVESVL